MEFLNPVISGAVRSVKSIKGVLVIWLSTLLMVSLVALPFRSSIRSVLGSSMITEKLKEGINIDVLTDFGGKFATILSALTSGMLLLIVSGFLLNVFFNGGLFTTLRSGEEKYSPSQFFRAAGTCFRPFLLITVIMTLILVLLSFLIFGLAFAIYGSSGEEGSEVRAAVTGGIIFILLLPVVLMVTDYARVWQAAAPKKEGFRAIGIGFRQTFRYFFSSYPVMLINLIIQALFSWFVLRFLSGTGPQTGGGIFLLFLLSQFLFIIKILLRVWRYGSVTAMYEKHRDNVFKY
jgi:NADH:ubiquinone oxidoreductase subunit 6 (subunit J)